MLTNFGFFLTSDDSNEKSSFLNRLVTPLIDSSLKVNDLLLLVYKPNTMNKAGIYTELNINLFKSIQVNCLKNISSLYSRSNFIS